MVENGPRLLPLVRAKKALFCLAAPSCLSLQPQIPHNFDEIEEWRNVFQFVNAALLQILGIDGAPPIGIREAGNAYQNLRHKLSVPYVLDSFLPIVVPFSFIPHELRELDNKPPQVKNRTLVGE